MSTYVYSRIRAVDLLEVANDQGGATTLTAAIAAIQSNGNMTNVCPKCLDQGGNPTGWNTIPTAIGTTKVLCTVCQGNLKTVQTYMPDPKNAGNFIALVISGNINIKLSAATSQLSSNVSGGSWTSGTPGTATINSQTGLVTAVAAGTTVITYTSGEYSTTVTFTVTQN